MKLKILVRLCSAFCILLCMSACDKARDSTGNVLDTAADESNATIDNLREVFGVGRKPPEKVNSQPRYCYQTYQDVICYSRPIAGENYRLVGWQDSNGHAGYVLPDGKVYAHATKLATVKKPDKDDKSTTTTTVVTKSTPTGTSNTVTIQSRTAGTATTSSSTTTDNSTAPKAPLKEIIFDPSELEPKQLVPDKTE